MVQWGTWLGAWNTAALFRVASFRLRGLLGGTPPVSSSPPGPNGAKYSHYASSTYVSGIFPAARALAGYPRPVSSSPPGPNGAKLSHYASSTYVSVCFLVGRQGFLVIRVRASAGAVVKFVNPDSKTLNLRSNP